MMTCYARDDDSGQNERSQPGYGRFKQPSTPYDRKTFMAALHEIRGLTRERPDVYQDRMIALSIRFGVALAWARELPGLRVAGASRWLSPKSALIQLSLLHATDADLMFTFFHEAAHILLHGRKQLFVEGWVDEGKPSRDDVFEEVCEQGILTRDVVHAFAGIAPASSSPAFST